MLILAKGGNTIKESDNFSLNTDTHTIMENVILSDKAECKLYQRLLFIENAWNFYKNSEMIMSNP